MKVGRFVGVDPEVAIHGTCEKFIRRYRAVEEGAAAMGRSVAQLPLETLEVEVLTVADNVGKAEAAAMYREIMDSPS